MIAFFRPKEPVPNPVADELRAQLAAERARVDDLLRQLAELRREGFNPPAPVPDLAEEGYALPSEVMAAIEQRASTKQARERLMQQARKLLLGGAPSEVAERIIEGEPFRWGA